jgi:hypothetical protein
MNGNESEQKGRTTSSGNKSARCINQKKRAQRDELLASAFAFLAGAFINFIFCTGKIGRKKLCSE